MALTPETLTHGDCRRYADAAWANRFLIVKKGSDNDHVALCGAADKPSGICPDSPDAAEDLIAVKAIGVNKDAGPVQVSGPVDVDDLLVPDANGQARKLPTVAGTYWVFAQAKQAAAAANEWVAAVTCVPYAVVVAGA